MSNSTFTKTFLLIIFLTFPILSYAQKSEVLLNHYHAEQKNWTEYINNFPEIPSQGNFDVVFYYINIKINIPSPYIEGNVECKFRITENNVDNIKLNLHNALIVDSISGDVKSFISRNDTLLINFNTTLQANEIEEVKIYYHGIPEMAGGYKGLRYEHHNGDEPVIATLSTPYLSHYWWPCKDGPGDKADSVYIDITIPDTTINGNPLIAVSNGLLVNTIIHENEKTFQWRERNPIVPYYVMAAISNYEHFQQQYIGNYGEQFPIDYYVFSEHLSEAQIGVSQIPEVIRFFSNKFGKYPFSNEKYGMTQLGYYSAIENQTNTIQNNMSLSWFDVSVHELAHMWFGDMITCQNWHHGWLNEGFATYCEALWAESIGGFEAYKENMASNQYWAEGTLYLGSIDNPYTDVFTSIIYQKGAYVLHMLRGVLGDSTFFDCLYEYANDQDFRYGHATTEDFKEVCENVSGMNLEKFFNEWVYGENYPKYSYGFTVDTAANGFDVNLIIDQTQTENLFWMPIQIEVITQNGGNIFTVWDSLATQTFTLNVSAYPIEVRFDPDNWILKETTDKIVDPALNQGVLLVNGVDWILGNKLKSAYEDKAFWGNTEISFWDIFDEPSSGYPEVLPEVVGNGNLSNFTLGNYSTIIWLSELRGNDLQAWQNLAIMDYLNAGGNIILITKRGKDFITESMKNYLGINWDESDYSTIKDFTSNNPDFSDIELLSDHSAVSLFETTLTSSESELIYVSTESFDSPKGSGVWSKPDGKGHFVYIAGRPYNFVHDDLKVNLEKILQNGLGEPVSVSFNDKLPSEFELKQNYPNPFNPVTKIEYSIPEDVKRKNGVTSTRLNVFDVLGRRVKTLVNKQQNPGNYKVIFDASKLSSGIYYFQLKVGNYLDAKKMLLLK